MLAPKKEFKLKKKQRKQNESDLVSHFETIQIVSCFAGVMSIFDFLENVNRELF